MPWYTREQLGRTNKTESESTTTSQEVSGKSTSSTSEVSEDNFTKNFGSFKNIKLNNGVSLFDELSSNDGIVNMINGQYDKVINSVPKDSDLYNDMVSAKKGIWYAANLYKQNDFKKANDYLNKSLNLFNDAKEKYNRSGKNFKITDDFRALDKIEYELEDENLHPLEVNGKAKRSIEAPKATKDDDDIINMRSRYFTFKSLQDETRNNTKDLLKNVTDSWLRNGSALIDKLPSKEKGQMYGTIVDALQFISKHGTESDKDKSKEKANNLLNQLRGKSWNEKVAIVKQNSTLLSNLGSSMGFYGAEYLYKNNKDNDFVKNINLYNFEDGVDKLKQKDDLFNKLNRRYSEYQEDTKKITEWKNTVMSAIKEQNDIDPSKRQLLDGLLDNEGNVVSYTEWRNNITKAGLNQELLKLSDKEVSKTTGATGGMWGATPTKDKEVLIRDLGTYYVNLYKDLVKTYKSKQVDIQAKDDDYVAKRILNNSSVNLFGYKGVSLEKDKDGNYKNTLKHETLFNILKIAKNDDGELDNDVLVIKGKGSNVQANTEFYTKEEKDVRLTGDIPLMFLPSNERVSSVALAANSDLQNKMYNDFFGKKRKRVEYYYEKTTRIPNYSAYHILDSDTKENITLFIPTAKVRKNNERLYSMTKRSVNDYDWEVNPNREITLRNFENAKLVRNDKGQIELQSSNRKPLLLNLPGDTKYETIEDVVRNMDAKMTNIDLK